MIVKRIVVVTLVGGDCVSPGGGGGGTNPGESICPANAETASAKLRIIAAHVRRRLFIVSLPSDEKKFA
jgi:hypothetical protein